MNTDKPERQICRNELGAFIVFENERVSELVKSGNPEPWVRTAIAKYADGQKTAIDLGACFGYHTISMARAFGHVIAYEPTREICQLLKANIWLNDKTNITVRRCAIGDRQKIMYSPICNIYADERRNLGASTMIMTDTMRYSKTVTGFRRTIVRPLDVEWAIAGKPPIGLIKIDIEGMEAEAITGAAELIERDRPVIVAEVAPNNVPQVCLILRQHGYTAERIKGDNFVFEQEENNAKKT